MTFLVWLAFVAITVVTIRWMGQPRRKQPMVRNLLAVAAIFFFGGLAVIMAIPVLFGY